MNDAAPSIVSTPPESISTTEPEELKVMPMTGFGIELLTIDLRVVVASVDTYLRFAEAVNRLDLQAVDEAETIPDLFKHGEEEGAEQKTKGAVEGGMDAIKEKVGLSRGENKEKDEEREGSRSSSRSDK